MLSLLLYGMNSRCSMTMVGAHGSSHSDFSYLCGRIVDWLNPDGNQSDSCGHVRQPNQIA